MSSNSDLVMYKRNTFDSKSTRVEWLEFYWKKLLFIYLIFKYFIITNKANFAKVNKLSIFKQYKNEKCPIFHNYDLYDLNLYFAIFQKKKKNKKFPPNIKSSSVILT